MHIGLVGQPGFLPKTTSRYPLGEWVDHEFRSYSCYFWTFQIELDRIDTKNFENGLVLEKLRTSKVGEHLIKFMKFKPNFNENPSFVFTQW